MIDFATSKIIRRTTENISAASAAIEEGQALIYALEDGEAVVKISDGSTTAAFAGFGQSERNTPTLLARCDRFKVITLPNSAGVGFILPRPIVGTPLLKYNNGAGTVIALSADNTPGAGEYYIDATGMIVTFEAGDLNKYVQITWKFSPTAADIMAGVGGDNTPTTTGSLVSFYRATGVIKQADDLRISNFDPAVNWDAWTPSVGLKAAANGIVTSGSGTGVTIAGRVVHAPDTDSEYLGLAFNVT